MKDLLIAFFGSMLGIFVLFLVLGLAVFIADLLAEPRPQLLKHDPVAIAIGDEDNLSVKFQCKMAKQISIYDFRCRIIPGK